MPNRLIPPEELFQSMLANAEEQAKKLPMRTVKALAKSRIKGCGPKAAAHFALIAACSEKLAALRVTHVR